MNTFGQNLRYGLRALCKASLGVNPVIGRLFLPEEDRRGGDVHKALISHRLRLSITDRTLACTGHRHGLRRWIISIIHRRNPCRILLVNLTRASELI
jgi:hypothetical protein